MAKKITAQIKLQITGGQATPAPPVGPALGQHGVNIPGFIKEFNARTSNMMGITIPVVITVFSDRSFSFITKSPPASVLLRMAAGVPKGSATPHTVKVGQVSEKQVEEIAKTKMADMNAKGDLESAKEMVRGTARSMGLTVVA